MALQLFSYYLARVSTGKAQSSLNAYNYGVFLTLPASKEGKPSLLFFYMCIFFFFAASPFFQFVGNFPISLSIFKADQLQRFASSLRLMFFSFPFVLHSRFFFYPFQYTIIVTCPKRTTVKPLFTQVRVYSPNQIEVNKEKRFVSLCSHTTAQTAFWPPAQGSEQCLSIFIRINTKQFDF